MPEDDKYDVLEKIGHGSFGIIRKVRRRSDGYILCRKEISYSKMSQKEREQLQAELSILKELRHPNIVAYFERDHIKQSQDLHLYMEYCGNGDLGRVIRNLKDKNQLAEEEFVWSIFSQIVSALYRCHYGEDPPAAGRNVMGLGANAKPGRPGTGKPMILHRDLKPENIFLGEDNSVKLGDFGLSKILQSHDFASTYVGTPFYMSPEICRAEQYGPHSDIWALGCIVYELCTKSPPFNAKTHWDLIQKIKAGRYTDLPSCYSPELKKVIAQCLQPIPHHRPDTAQLLNMPLVKLMRKEQEVVKLGHELKEQKQLATQTLEAANKKMAQANEHIAIMRREIDSQLRREWEVKARLEIDRQVALELEKLRAKFDEEVEKKVNDRVKEALARHGQRMSTSPRLAPRSNTPTMPAEHGPLFPSDSTDLQQVSGVSSIDTLGSASEFPSSTDISTLSLDEPSEDTIQAQPKPKPAAKRTRAPLSRAKTAFAGHAAPPPPSPMDVTMGEPSPAPGAIASLSLSPRRTAPRANIFAAAAKLSKKWEPELPPSPTEEAWNGDFDDDDDVPVLPSPTRARSASGTRNEDPFKVLANAQRPLIKENQRLGSAPNLGPSHAAPATKSRPNSTVPIVATSPSRKPKPSENRSPVRKTAAPRIPPIEGGGLKSKKGNEQIRLQAMRNNGIQGRTLVELQQARGIPTQAMSEDEGKRGMKTGLGFRSPVKAKSAAAAVWDPEVEVEMPSPFLVKSRKVVK